MSTSAGMMSPKRRSILQACMPIGTTLSLFTESRLLGLKLVLLPYSLRWVMLPLASISLYTCACNDRAVQARKMRDVNAFFIP